MSLFPRKNALDAVVVGAGFSGLYMLHLLQRLGLSAQVIEAGPSVGGTWYWNSYPGARCDVESLNYCYSFDPQLQREWQWSERYPTQPEILRYLNHVADRFDLRRDILLGTRVIVAHYDDRSRRWDVRTDSGREFSAQYCIMATGCLSTARLPDIDGLKTFKGRWFHTGQWPKEPIDFTGESVGVIGTGSTGIQVIPVVARQAKKLTVFQRTPNFSVPARNRPLTAAEVEARKAVCEEHNRQARVSLFGVPWPLNMQMALDAPPNERNARFEAAWNAGGATPMLTAYIDLLANERANETAADFVRARIREIVKDPKVAALLSPTDHPLGTKRICVDTDYYATYNRDNVELIDLRASPIVEITEWGVRTTAAHYELDSLIFATGFDAMTGSLLAIDIRGRGGRRLRDKWNHGPRSYLGLMSEGFPNLFTVTGPGSPSVLSNVVVSIEQHVEWIAACIQHLRKTGKQVIEPVLESENKWVEHVNEVANTTLYPKANSWYVGANVPGKPRVFMPYVGGVGAYRQVCDDVVAKGYEGFRLDA
jgi:cyclohexanone monooxygenase